MLPKILLNCLSVLVNHIDIANLAIAIYVLYACMLYHCIAKANSDA